MIAVAIILLLLLLLLLLTNTVAWAAETQQNCPHGLTANEIAGRSGIDLSGKTALVTGGRSGLGYAISEALLRQNCTVVIASRDEALNQEAVASLKDTVPGANVSYRIFDLEEFQIVRTFATEFTATHSRLDYYFGNAGQGEFGALPLTVDGYERIFQVNYLAQILLVELLLPLLSQGNEPSRILLTGSSSHSLACGTLGLSSFTSLEDFCFGDDGTATSLLPFDRAGLDAINNTFACPPLAGTYPLTKFLLVQAAREITERAAASGRSVYAYAWAPGNIRTDLNPFASCCVGPTESFGPLCRYQLPYVGPKDSEGNPNPPDPPVPNRWSSPSHGTMAALYVALEASISDAGKFFATYWECEPDKGYFPQGISPQVRAELYDRSKEWAGLGDETPTTSPSTDPPSSAPVSAHRWALILLTLSCTALSLFLS